MTCSERVMPIGVGPVLRETGAPVDPDRHEHDPQALPGPLNSDVLDVLPPAQPHRYGGIDWVASGRETSEAMS